MALMNRENSGLPVSDALRQRKNPAGTYQFATASSEMLAIRQAIEVTQQTVASARALLLSIVSRQQQCIQCIEPSIRSLTGQLGLGLRHKSPFDAALKIIFQYINSGYSVFKLPTTPEFEARAFDWKKQGYYQTKYRHFVQQYDRLIQLLLIMPYAEDGFPPELNRCKQLNEELHTLADQFEKARMTLHDIFTKQKQLEARLRKIQRYTIAKQVHAARFTK